jgi:hypothetical protein
MSVARAVQDLEPIRLDWLTVEDTDGRVWRYRRIGSADLAESAHVEGHFTQGHPLRAYLVRDHDGRPLLRQDAPGLPRVMILQYIEDPSDLYLTALGLPGKAEYLLES